MIGHWRVEEDGFKSPNVRPGLMGVLCWLAGVGGCVRFCH